MFAPRLPVIDDCRAGGGGGNGGTIVNDERGSHATVICVCVVIQLKWSEGSPSSRQVLEIRKHQDSNPHELIKSTHCPRGELN